MITAAVAAATGATPSQAGPLLLFEPASGRVLYAEDQDNHWHPASLTKIMTAYLTFEALKTGRLTLEQKIAVSEKASLQAPSKIGLPVGAEITVDFAMKAVIIKSANDAAVMLAEAIAGSEEAFVKLMNDTALRLGMTRTNFVNPNGLPAPEQVTTARDLAKLSRAVLRDFPDQAPLWALTEAKAGKLQVVTHNRLLKSYKGADGIKTGFICDSGFNVVASATRDGKKLVAVVLGDPSGRERNIRAASLLDHGFQMDGWKQVFTSKTLDTLPMAADAKGVTSIRETVSGWECGSRKRPKPIAKKAKGAPGAATAAAKDKAKSKAAAPKAAAKPAGPAVNAAAAAVKAKPAAKSE